jgi:hypothetical protein
MSTGGGLTHLKRENKYNDCAQDRRISDAYAIAGSTGSAWPNLLAIAAANKLRNS